MTKITTGQDAGGGVVVLKGDAAQMRKIRCPSCTSVAMSEKDGQGRPINSCTNCGRKWRSVKM